MQAAILREGRIVVDEVRMPEPGPGQVLVRTMACGICGSDLHAARHGPAIAAAGQEGALFGNVDFSRDVVMGHEFCAEIAEYGRDTRRQLRTGALVCSLPVVLPPEGRHTVGYSNIYPGGYGEFMLLDEALLLPVPEGLPTDIAALTEPVAVGLHAVNKARVNKADVPLVIGCGPVGLAVIWALKRDGFGPIVAADYSPLCRDLAERMGADVVVDPARDNPHQVWQGEAAMEGLPNNLKPAVIFECVGVPGVIQELMSQTPRQARIVVVGVCMEADRILPIDGILRELNIQFVLGYSPEEFADALAAVAEGRLEVSAMITGTVGLDGVAGAFRDLDRPDAHAKIIIRPS